VATSRRSEVANRRDHYLYYNGHGDLAAEANASGVVTATHTYDAFGAPLDTPPANGTSHRYVGEWDKQYDSASSLILMGARPYDPTLGRFLAVDPIDGGSLNNYDYAGQDPTNGYDLSGTMLAAVDGGPVLPKRKANESAAEWVASICEYLGVSDAIVRGNAELGTVSRGDGFTVKAKGQGLRDNSNTIRINFKSNGDVQLRYTNSAGEYVDPRTGQGIPGSAGRTSPLTHIDLNRYFGPFKNLPFSNKW
jgi:RHS repeat-associated protein